MRAPRADGTFGVGCWRRSTDCARHHYPRTALVTDDDARLLVDGLGLEFDSVSLALNELAGHDPSWWTAGKLVAISEQDEPFVHLDTDVFLWSAPRGAHRRAVLRPESPSPTRRAARTAARS
jgi:Family of unknown function (DUF6734)